MTGMDLHPSIPDLITRRPRSVANQALPRVTREPARQRDCSRLSAEDNSGSISITVRAPSDPVRESGARSTPPPSTITRYRSDRCLEPECGMDDQCVAQPLALDRERADHALERSRGSSADRERHLHLEQVTEGAEAGVQQDVADLGRRPRAPMRRSPTAARARPSAAP